MRILVTGGLGTIGSHAVPALRNEGHSVVIADRLLSDAEDYARADVRLYEELAPLFPVDLVIHMAGEVGVRSGEEHPRQMLEVNVIGALNLARLAKEHGAGMIYFSTSEVYGVQDERCTEDSIPAPRNVYGVSKLAGEYVVRHYLSEATIVRPFMVYGPGEKASPYRSALVNFITKALNGETLTAHNGATRSWCHISDFVAGLLCVMEQPGTYNLGSDDPRSMEELAHLVCQIVGDGRVEIGEVPPERTAYKVADISRLRALGYEPQVSLEDGLLELICSLSG
jgi:nucleoside-diphosphate-sugar epimerase